MLADLAPNVHVDTSSSNGWIRYHPGLTLTGVFRQALAVLSADRILFGTDSSFFPRGWQEAILHAQVATIAELELSDEDTAKILAGNFERIFA
jgi:predicted TIM-barrel fold metal-dependent hydrolase